MKMIAQQLAKMIGQIRYDSMPQEVKGKASQCCCDMLGVFLGGRGMKEGHIVKRALVGNAPGIENSAQLALWIGSVTRLLDFDDGHRRAMGHPGVPIWSAALALAATRRISGSRFAEAAVGGYDVYCHVGRAINPRAYLERGFDATCICGSVAAAATAGILMKLDENEIANAISIAASLCGGLNQYAIDGGSPKYLCAGWAAMLGIQAAKLAQCGADGPSAIFEGKKGFCQGFAVEYDRALLDDTTLRWDILDVYLKRFACVRRLHAALDIVDELVGHHALNLDHIDSIDVVGSRFIAESAIYNPASVVLAQTSMPYAIAILLKFGKVTEELIGTHLDDPEIHVLAGKIRVGEEEFFNRLMEEKKGLWGAAKVTLTTKFGEIHSKTLEYALGERENPLPPQILKKKFMTLATESIDEDKAKDIFEKLADFTLISNVGDIVSELFQS